MSGVGVVAVVIDLTRDRLGVASFVLGSGILSFADNKGEECSHRGG